MVYRKQRFPAVSLPRSRFLWIAVLKLMIYISFSGSHRPEKFFPVIYPCGRENRGGVTFS
jgi:hypothetical protein